MSTTIINLFGGPGIGKSTTAAYIFTQLKTLNYKCELVTEYAKDLTYSQRFSELEVQPYVFGKQLSRIERVINHVDYIITDSPILLSIFYTSNKWPKSFITSVIDIFNLYNNRNFLLERQKAYSKVGRTQTEEEAIKIDKEIKKILLINNIEYRTLPGSISSINVKKDILNVKEDNINDNDYRLKQCLLHSCSSNYSG